MLVRSCRSQPRCLRSGICDPLLQLLTLLGICSTRASAEKCLEELNTDKDANALQKPEEKQKAERRAKPSLTASRSCSSAERLCITSLVDSFASEGSKLPAMSAKLRSCCSSMSMLAVTWLSCAASSDCRYGPTQAGCLGQLLPRPNRHDVTRGRSVHALLCAHLYMLVCSADTAFCITHE